MVCLCVSSAGAVSAFKHFENSTFHEFSKCLKADTAPAELTRIVRFERWSTDTKFLNSGSLFKLWNWHGHRTKVHTVTHQKVQIRDICLWEASIHTRKQRGTLPGGFTSAFWTNCSLRTGNILCNLIELII